MNYTFKTLLEIIVALWTDPKNDGDAIQALYKYAIGLRNALSDIIKEQEKK